MCKGNADFYACEPCWRNRQTQRPQKLPPGMACWFDPSAGHQVGAFFASSCLRFRALKQLNLLICLALQLESCFQVVCGYPPVAKLVDASVSEADAHGACQFESDLGDHLPQGRHLLCELAMAAACTEGGC